MAKRKSSPKKRTRAKSSRSAGAKKRGSSKSCDKLWLILGIIAAVVVVAGLVMFMSGDGQEAQEEASDEALAGEAVKLRTAKSTNQALAREPSTSRTIPSQQAIEGSLVDNTVITDQMMNQFDDFVSTSDISSGTFESNILQGTGVVSGLMFNLDDFKDNMDIRLPEDRDGDGKETCKEMGCSNFPGGTCLCGDGSSLTNNLGNIPTEDFIEVFNDFALVNEPFLTPYDVLMLNNIVDESLIQ